MDLLFAAKDNDDNKNNDDNNDPDDGVSCDRHDFNYNDDANSNSNDNGGGESFTHSIYLNIYPSTIHSYIH